MLPDNRWHPRTAGRSGLRRCHRRRTGIARIEPDRHYRGHNLAVTPAGVSKASGVAAYITSHGLDGVSTVAVGDGINNIELLACAELAIRVENSPPDLARYADHTIRPPDEHGWADLVDLLLSQP